MQNRTFRRHLIWLGIAGMVASVPAQAFRFEINDDTYGEFKNQVLIGASWRMQRPSDSLIDKNNVNPNLCGFGTDDACMSFNGNPALNQKLIDAPGAFFGANKDDGNLNYDRGDIVASVFKLTSEVSLTWGEWVFKAGGTAFIDPQNYHFDETHPDTNFQPATTRRNHDVERNVGYDFQIGNLMASRPFELFNHDFSIAIGYQTIRWGESTLVALNSISEINAPDARFLYHPGTPIAAVFQTTPAVVLSTPLTDDINIDLVYQLAWRKVQVPKGGSFFALLDLIGRDTALLSLGQFHEDPDGLQRLPSIGANISNSSTTVAVDNKGGEPRDSGQFGTKVTWYNADIGTEFGFYALNYHSRLPYLSMFAADASCISDTTTDAITALAECQGMKANPDGLEPAPLDTAKFVLDYPENIQMYGVSFNTTAGKWSLAGEVSYRPNLPAQIHAPDIVFAGVQPALPMNELVVGLGTVGQLGGILQGVLSGDTLALQNLTGLLGGTLANPGAVVGNLLSIVGAVAGNLGNDFALPPRDVAVPSFVREYRGGAAIQPNQFIPGYERLKVMQFDFTGIRILSSTENPIGADQIQFIGEVGATWVLNMPDRNRLQFEGMDFNNTHYGPGADGTGEQFHPQGANAPANPTVTQRLNPTHQSTGFADAFAAGYRFLIFMEYNNALFGKTLKPQILWSHDLTGISIAPMQNFVQGTKLWQVGTHIELTQDLTAMVFYQGWTGGGTNQTYRDKDFAGFAVQYTF